MQEHPTTRFEADTGAARNEQIMVGLIVAVLAPVMLYLAGAQNILLLALSGALGGVAGYGIYALRHYVRAAQTIEIASDAVIVTTQRRQMRLPWAEIREVGRRSHYGDFLLIYVQGEKHPHTILLEGYTSEQIRAIEALIRQRSQQNAQ
ncbi:MAG TPA: hypothetical protein VFZ66_28410 [Herpetosiphonaceae bacterium]